MQQNPLKRFEECIQFSAKIKYMLRKKKNTAVLFSFENDQTLQNVGKWMLGAKINIGNKYELIDDKGINSQKINLSQKSFIYIHQENKSRVITVNNLQSFQQNGKEDSLANLLLALTLISKVQETKKILICGLVDQNDKRYSITKTELSKRFCNILFVQQNPKQQKEGAWNILKNDGDDSKASKSINEFLDKNNQDNIFKNYINLKMQQIKNTPNITIKSLQNLRTSLSKYIFFILKPLVKIFQNVYKSTDVQKYQLKQLFENEVNYIKQFLNGNKYLQNQIQNIRQIQKQKLDDSFAWKYFTMCYIMHRQQGEQKYRRKQYNNSIQLFKEFVNKLLEDVAMLPLNLDKYDLKYLFVMINLIEEQSWLLEEINERFCGLQVSEVYFSLDLKIDNNLTVKLKQIQEKIAEDSVKIQLKSNQQSDYYTSIQHLLQISFQNLDLSKLSKKDEINKNMIEIQQKLPMMKTIAVIQNEYSDNKQIAESIRYFFKKYLDNNNKGKFDSNFLFKIFKNIAKKLRNMGYIQLALEIYMKIKFQNQIQRCVNDLILKNGSQKTKYASKMYKSVSQYFLLYGNITKANKYAQLAYESSNDISYIKYMMEIKDRKFKNNYINDEAKLVQGLNKQGVADFNSYFNYQFDQQFQQSMLKLQGPTEDYNICLDIVATQEQLSKFSFFSQALTSDQ